ncbi:unnamed protein product [Ectocarpus sp. CCAP 1310/34]|nr:unnamed protein product [Ectocarpus sp. CCAP 1310/34]
MVYPLSAKGRGSPHRGQQNGNGGGVIPREKVSRFVFLSTLLVVYSAFTLGLIFWNSKSSGRNPSEPSPIDQSGGGGSFHLGSEASAGGDKVASSLLIREGRRGAGAGETQAGFGNEGKSTRRHSPAGSAGSNKLVGASGGEGMMHDERHGGGGFGASGVMAPRPGEARPAGAHKVRVEDAPSFVRQGGQGDIGGA